MSGETRSAALDAAWLSYMQSERSVRSGSREDFAAGFAAGAAHAITHTSPLEVHTCMVANCGKPAIVGTRKGPTYQWVWECGDHFVPLHITEVPGG